MVRVTKLVQDLAGVFAVHGRVAPQGIALAIETQGLRDDRVWGIWSIYPDGRAWAAS